MVCLLSVKLHNWLKRTILLKSVNKVYVSFTPIDLCLAVCCLVHSQVNSCQQQMIHPWSEQFFNSALWFRAVIKSLALLIFSSGLHNTSLGIITCQNTWWVSGLICSPWGEKSILFVDLDCWCKRIVTFNYTFLIDIMFVLTFKMAEIRSIFCTFSLKNCKLKEEKSVLHAKNTLINVAVSEAFLQSEWGVISRWDRGDGSHLNP